MHLLGRDPEFCIIAPTAYLEEYAPQSESHLILAHLVDLDDNYAAFYNNLSNTHLKIMDNGAFELGESYTPSRLIELGHKCNADVIVLPDYPFCGGFKTINAAEKLIDEIRTAGFKTMFVPQSQQGDTQDWINTYQWAAEHPDVDVIGMSILGIPNAIPHMHTGYARVVMTQMLMDLDVFNAGKHHHYLGLNSGPKLEIPSLINLGALDTCDSSAPVWAGITGHRYCPHTDSFMATSKVKMAVDFEFEWSDDKIMQENIQYNVDLTLCLFE